jgi:hypothetical protein
VEHGRSAQLPPAFDLAVIGGGQSAVLIQGADDQTSWRPQCRCVSARTAQKKGPHPRITSKAGRFARERERCGITRGIGSPSPELDFHTILGQSIAEDLNVIRESDQPPYKDWRLKQHRSWQMFVLFLSYRNGNYAIPTIPFGAIASWYFRQEEDP